MSLHFHRWVHGAMDGHTYRACTLCPAIQERHGSESGTFWAGLSDWQVKMLTFAAAPTQEEG